MTLSRASTQVDELPKKKEKKLQNETQTPLSTRTTLKSRKRAWANKNKPVAPNDVVTEFFQTMKTISNAIEDTDGPSQKKSSGSEDFD